MTNYRFNERNAEHFTSRKGEIITKLRGKIARRKENEQIAARVVEAIKDWNGKAYNARFDKVISKIAEQAKSGLIRTRIERKQNCGNRNYYIEIELRNQADRYSYTEYESYYLNVEISDWTNGRIKADTLECPSVNAATTNELEQAIKEFDQTAELYRQLNEIADKMNNTSYYLRGEMEKVYLSGLTK